MYSTVDSTVVGNFVGKDALAAADSSAPVIQLVLSFFSGISAAAGYLVF